MSKKVVNFTYQIKMLILYYGIKERNKSRPNEWAIFEFVFLIAIIGFSSLKSSCSFFFIFYTTCKWIIKVVQVSTLIIHSLASGSYRRWGRDKWNINCSRRKEKNEKLNYNKILNIKIVYKKRRFYIYFFICL